MKIRMHGESARCWCKPVRFYEWANGEVMWLHRYEDGTLPGIFYQVTEIALRSFGDPRDPGDVILEWELEEAE